MGQATTFEYKKRANKPGAPRLIRQGRNWDSQRKFVPETKIAVPKQEKSCRAGILRPKNPRHRSMLPAIQRG